MTPPTRPQPSGGFGRLAAGAMLPDQRTLLSWLLLARLGVAVGVLIAASLVWTAEADTSFILSILVVFALIVTGYTAWSVYLRRREPGNVIEALQVLVDVTLVTALVHVAGTRSAFAALYVLLVAAYAVLLPFRIALLAAFASTLFYALDALVLQRETIDGAVWVQVLVFNVVFAVVAVLGARLRRASEQEQTLKSELVRVRLEADDILRTIRSGVLTVESAGRLAFINPMAERLLELDGPALMGQPVLERLRVRCPELWTALTEGIQHGRKVDRGEGLVRRSSGAQFPIGLSTTTFLLAGSASTSVTAVFTDISESKNLQALVLRAERLEAVAALSASLAHEIRNPLAAIRSSVEQLTRGRQASEDDRVLGKLVMRESDRLNRLLAEFLDFSRVRARRAERVDLRALALGAVAMVREHPDCREDAEVVVTGEGAVIEGDEDLLHRIVSNLALNAVQVAAGPVRVEVQVAMARPDEVPPGMLGEAPARLTVRDNGPGIAPDIRERLFEPFVTGRAGGTGLGLAIVQRAVDAHHGVVLVESTPDTGTAFTIFLPTHWAAEQAA